MARMRILGLREFERDLAAVLDDRTIHKHLADRHGKEIVNAIIGTAKAGIGPGNAPFAPYSPAYRRRIEKAGGTKFWLRGIDRRGRGGGMLDPERFEVVVDPEGGGAVEWQPADSRMAAYGPVHQGTRYGGENDTRGRIPPRPWLHFDNAANQAAVMKAYELTIDELAAAFSAGKRPK